MQADLKRGKASYRMRGVGLSVAILTSATLSLYAPNQALAASACGTSHAGSAHAAGNGAGSVHAPTTTVAASGGSGGSGTLGCAGGSTASAPHGLTTATSGRVVEPNAHAGHNASTARTAATKTTNAAVHLHTVGHHA
jgi:hypothetical protein